MRFIVLGREGFNVSGTRICCDASRAERRGGRGIPVTADAP